MSCEVYKTIQIKMKDDFFLIFLGNLTFRHKTVTINCYTRNCKTIAQRIILWILKN